MTKTDVQNDLGATAVAVPLPPVLSASLATAADVLRAARNLLTAAGAWTQKAYARDHEGTSIDERDGYANATCWCLYGAIRHAGNFRDQRKAEDSVAGALLATVLNNDVTGFNDALGRTQADVLAALDQALALAEPSST